MSKCLWTRAEVRPGHVVKKPELMAVVQVEKKGAEGRSMEVLDNVGLGGNWVDVVRNRGGQRYGFYGGLLGALEVHVVESIGGVTSALQGGGTAD